MATVALLAVRIRPLFGGEAAAVGFGAGLLLVLVGHHSRPRLLTLRRPSRAGADFALIAVAVGWASAGTLGPTHPLVGMSAEVAAILAAGCSMAWDADDPARLALGPAFGIILGIAAAAGVGAIVGMSGAAWVAVPVAEGCGVVAVQAGRRRRGPERPITFDVAELGREAATVIVLLGLGLAAIFLAYHSLQPVVPFGRDMQHPVNVASMLRTGRPAPGNVGADAFYPTTAWYLLGALALPLHVSATAFLASAVPVLWLVSVVGVFAIGRSLLGYRAATAAAVVYALCSFQPKQTLLDGTDIGVLSEYTLMPLALLATYLLITRRDRVSVAGWAVCAAGLIQVHFLAFSRFALVGGALLVGSVFVVRPLGPWIGTMGRAVGGAVVLGLPYSVRYAGIYAGSLGRYAGIDLGGSGPGRYPIPAVPGSYTHLLGGAFVWTAVGALTLWLVAGARGRARQAEWWVLSVWFVLVGLSALTGLLVAAERDLRSLAIPAALLIGWSIDAVAGAVTEAMAGAALVLGLSLALLAGFPSAEAEYLTTARVSVYASASQMQFLDSVPWSTLAGRVVADESGVWVPYFAGLHTLGIAGGPAAFLWFGQPQRQEMTTAWDALRPCTATSAGTLLRLGVRYVFLGPPPTHWTPPGYTYEPPMALSGCPGFSVVLSDRAGGDYLFAVR